MSADDVLLSSSAGSLGGFAVRISGASPASLRRAITIEGTDRSTHARRTRAYDLPDTGHHAYLDLFADIARDFGTRMPRNRSAAAAPTFSVPFRPLLTENLSPDMLYGYGDPAVIHVPADSADAGAGWYYLVVTSNDAPQSFPIARSRDLTAWELVGFVFPQGRKPHWAANGEGVSDYWAPEMHQIAGEFRIYFAARESDGRTLSIGVAAAGSPNGPFVAADEPLLRGDVIDPHILVDRGGTPYLLWKEDTNGAWPSELLAVLHEHEHLVTRLFSCPEDRLTASLLRVLWPWARDLAPMERFFVQQVLIEGVIADFGTFKRRLATVATEGDARLRASIGEVLRALRTPIYGQRLAPDGLHLVGERRIVIENDQDWEAHLVEGVWVREHGGRYYMFYSGNDFSTAEYGIGVAVADAPLGPYRKMDAPLLRSTAEWSGPGHPSVADGPDGGPMLFLHAYFPDHSGYKQFRALLTLPIAFEGDAVVVRPTRLLGNAGGRRDVEPPTH